MQMSLELYSGKIQCCFELRKTVLDLNLMQKFDIGSVPIYIVTQNNFYIIMKIFPIDSQYFEREIKFKDLNHENIVKMIDFGTGNQKDTTFKFILYQFCSNGNFSINLRREVITLDETLVRTYFHQFVSAIEYMHASNNYHLDLKLENLFLSHDYQLKVGDFDQSWNPSCERNISRFSEDYVPPEYDIQKEDLDKEKADIYTMGVCLIGMMLKGEDGIFNETDREKFYENSFSFWEDIEAKYGKLESNFKSLIEGMLCRDPKKRISIDNIKENEWYNGRILLKNEIENYIISQQKNNKF